MDNMQDKIKKVAVYVGAFYNKESDVWLLPSKSENIVLITLNIFLTDLNILHPIAMRVVDELLAIQKAEGKYNYTIVCAVDLINRRCAVKPNEQAQYLDLFNAVYDGVELLEKLKL